MIQSRLNPSTSTPILSPLRQRGMSSWQKALKVALILSMMSVSRSISFAVAVVTLFSTSHREDVITLQNPHGLPSASVPITSASVTQKDKVVATVKPAVAGPVSAAQKEAVPCPFRLSFSFNSVLRSPGLREHISLLVRSPGRLIDVHVR
jgi:hypothetical protein